MKPNDIDNILNKNFINYQKTITHKHFDNTPTKPDDLMILDKVSPSEHDMHTQYYNSMLGREWEKLLKATFSNSPYAKNYQSTLITKDPSHKKEHLHPCDLRANGYGIDAKYRIGSGDSKFSKEMPTLAKLMKKRGLQPTLLIYRSDNLDNPINKAKNNGYKVIQGSKACSQFIRHQTGIDLVGHIHHAAMNRNHLHGLTYPHLQHRNRGTYVCVEGLDGTGKSTTERTLQHHLEAKGHKILLTHEPFVRFPNGVPYKPGQKMFKKIEDPHIHLTHKQKRNMFAENAKAHMKLVVRPALKKGETVVSDRGLLSSLAYQGVYKKVDGKMVDTNHVIDANKKIQGKDFTMPDKTVYLYLKHNAEEVSRIEGRGIDIGKEDLDDKRVIKNLNSMKKRYQYGLHLMKHKLNVPYTMLDAHQLPNARAKKLGNIIHETEMQNNLKPDYKQNFEHNIRKSVKIGNEHTKPLKKEHIHDSKPKYTHHFNGGGIHL